MKPTGKASKADSSSKAAVMAKDKANDKGAAKDWDNAPDADKVKGRANRRVANLEVRPDALEIKCNEPAQASLNAARANFSTGLMISWIKWAVLGHGSRKT